MNRISQAEQYLLGQIRQGDNEAWSQLIDRYQGRLLAYARSRLPTAADVIGRVVDDIWICSKNYPSTGIFNARR